jgi:taurine dioxygenase
MPPAQPDPPLTPAGGLPVSFPQRRGWHTDQSFRRPPPDISLFYAVLPSPPGQGQTLYADAASAYDALSVDLKSTVEGLQGIHAIPGIGRAEYAVKAGETPKPLLPHQRPQRQPVVRTHPVTGRRSLYLCEAGQMDWIDGPFVGMEPGPEGDGAALLYELMMHMTQPEFTYVHEWSQGDLLIWDNRNLLHCATWYDAQNHQRLMWRTTTRGNPGELYSGEDRSWLPEDDARPMAGLDSD